MYDFIMQRFCLDIVDTAQDAHLEPLTAAGG